MQLPALVIRLLFHGDVWQKTTTDVTAVAGGYACLAGLCFTPDLYAWYELALVCLTVAHA